MNARLNIAAGKSYKNGWGTRINIVSAPTPECRWHTDEFGNYYHPNGEMAVISGSAKSNLASEIQPGVGPYYAKDGMVWKHPVYTKRDDGTTTITIGFPVCRMHDAVGDDAAETVAQLMNAGASTLTSPVETP